MAQWNRPTVFAWQEPPYADRRPVESPQDAVDLVRVTLRACQRALHGPFSAAGDAVLLEVGVENELRRAVAAAGELADPGGDAESPGWFEARVVTYRMGHEWIDGRRVRRDRVPDHSELLTPVTESVRTARAALRGVVTAVQKALEPWVGMRQSCMTRENLADINGALLAYDDAAAAHYRVFAAFRAARTAEIEHAWRGVPTEPDLPLPIFGEARESL